MALNGRVWRKGYTVYLTMTRPPAQPEDCLPTKVMYRQIVRQVTRNSETTMLPSCIQKNRPFFLMLNDKVELILFRCCFYSPPNKPSKKIWQGWCAIELLSLSVLLVNSNLVSSSSVATGYAKYLSRGLLTRPSSLFSWNSLYFFLLICFLNASGKKASMFMLTLAPLDPTSARLQVRNLAVARWRSSVDISHLIFCW